MKRRTALAALTGALSTLAGCNQLEDVLPDDGPGGDTPTDTVTQTPGEDTETTTDGPAPDAGYGAGGYGQGGYGGITDSQS